MNAPKHLHTTACLVATIVFAAAAHAQTGMPQGVPGMPQGIPGNVQMPPGVPGAMPNIPAAGGDGVPGTVLNMPPGLAAGGPPPEIRPPVTLSAGDIDSFMTTMKGLKELDIPFDDSDDANGMADALSNNQAAMAVLSKNGFTVERFDNVAYSIGMAMAGIEMKGKAAEMAADRAERTQQLAELKASLPPAQYDAIAGQMTAMDRMLTTIEQQPPANVELVSARRGEIEAMLAEEHEED